MTTEETTREVAIVDHNSNTAAPPTHAVQSYAPQAGALLP